jgi:hypothetical protein
VWIKLYVGMGLFNWEKHHIPGLVLASAALTLAVAVCVRSAARTATARTLVDTCARSRVARLLRAPASLPFAAPLASPVAAFGGRRRGGGPCVTAALLLAAAALFGVTLFAMERAGKQALWPEARGLHDWPSGFSTVAMVYAREQLPGLLAYLRDDFANRTSTPIDIRLGDYLDSVAGRVRAFMGVPHLFQHIGDVGTISSSERRGDRDRSILYDDD